MYDNGIVDIEGGNEWITPQEAQAIILLAALASVGIMLCMPAIVTYGFGF